MPYALADAWFEEKFNSVSFSFSRQTMGKARDGKKYESHKSASRKGLRLPDPGGKS